MVARKKLTLITSFFESPYHRNRAPYNEQLFYELSKMHDVKIIRPVAWTDILKFKREKEIINPVNSQWKGVPIRFPVFLYLPKVGLRVNGFLYLSCILIPFVLQFRRPDVIYTTWAYPDAFAAMLLSRIIRCPYIVRVHGSDINDLATRPALRGKIKKVLSRASLVVSPSQDLKNKMVSLGVPEEKIAVVYSGVNESAFHPMSREACREQLGLDSRKKLTYIGNMKEAKGVVDLVRAAVMLRDSGRDFELMLIGKGDIKGLLREKIPNDENLDFIRLVGEINHDDLAMWINSSNCVCLPSYNEGVPNVLLETMSCGVNIVATRVGGIPEIVQNPSTCLVEPGDVPALVEKLAAMLEVDDFITEPAIELRNYAMVSREISSYIDNVRPG